MIQSGDNSIRERIKSDVLQEVQRVLLTYEERIAVLEKENRLLWEENRKLGIVLDDLTFSVDAFEEEMKAKINDAVSNWAET
jgi:phage baseplate assembly protein W